MTRKCGYYVHHHGTGHLARALGVAAAAPERFVLLGTGLAGRTGDIAYLELPDDRQAAAAMPTEMPEALHFAPLDCDALRARAALLTGWIAQSRPALLVVDVSVEIAMLARLASTPVIYVRLAGRRVDTPHLEAFRAARALLAPFHQALDDPQTLPWVTAKTRYIPGLTAFVPDAAPDPDRVLVVLGTGGTAITGAELEAAARATPALDWRVIGPAPRLRAPPPNLQNLGWVANAGAEIAAAGIVVGAAGDGVVNAVLAAGRPFICLPQARPFDEQVSKAARLAALGAALSLPAWPAAALWPEVIAAARRLDPGAQARLHDADGAGLAAAFIADCAG